MLGDDDFDYAGLLESLEAFRVPTFDLPGPSVVLPEWRWPLLRPYNGFGGEQRVRIWQVSRWAQVVGLLRRPEWCSVCDSGSRVGFHNENYAHPWTPIPLCQSCHHAVHRRFSAPGAWGLFQARHSRPGPPLWFTLLPATPIDLAARLRHVTRPER